MSRKIELPEVPFESIHPDEWRKIIVQATQLAILDAPDNGEGTIYVLTDSGGDYRVTRHWYNNGERADIAAMPIDTYEEAVRVAVGYALNGWPV